MNNNINNKFNIKMADQYSFIEYKENNIAVYFSTAENGLDFNRNLDTGINNLNNLKNWFPVKEVTYLNQIHSDKIFIADNNSYCGDALITNEVDRAIGVFTADCVPIILIDHEHNAIATIHSGWKGTVNNIATKTIKEMIKTYNTDVSKLKVLIGPHIRKCCFEVGEEIIELFNKNKLFTKDMVINNRYIDLEGYILSCLKSEGVNSENIILVNLCTYCNSKLKMHSYRRDKLSYGRMFSFAFIKGYNYVLHDS